MVPQFVDCDRESLFLMPPSVADWLPENHLARFVVDIVSQLDLTALEYAYAGRGSNPYHPRTILALLFYGYATGVFSSRRLEAATFESVAFRYIAANTHPDHDTIAHFRKRFLGELKPLFAQILMIAHTMGVLKVGKVSLDGTKVKANASKHRALSWGYACKLEEQLKAEVERLMGLAEEADKEDLPDGMSIPEELARRKERLERIAEAKAEIQRRADERYALEKDAYEKKVSERKAKEESTGKKPRGKEPKPPQSGPKKSDQVSLTDKESRIMPVHGGAFEQCYNSQAAVEMDSFLIVESHVTQHTNDKQEIEPTLANLSTLPDEMGKVEDLAADSGYFSEANVKKCEANGITPYIPAGRQEHNRPLEELLSPIPASADGDDAVAKMKHRLKTPEGKGVYAKRKSTVETVFGIIKAVMGFRQFLLRGLQSVLGEWDLVCMAYNLKRLHTLAPAKG